MTEKIEWYQEVLELEPSSKVFFPLAKLLASNHQLADAIATLRQGLDRHPEFFEARLMLIDLLQQAGQEENSLYEVERLGSKLMLYPGFWQAWAAVVENNGQPDEAVALRLLAAFLSGKNITLLDILQAGLKSALGLPAMHAKPTKQDRVGKLASLNQTTPAEIGAENSPESFAKVASPYISGSTLSKQPSALGLILEKDDQASMGTKGIFALARDTAPNNADNFTGTQATDAPDAAELDEEPFSLRTKTMAAVLMEQGDFQGALDIYEELLAANDKPEKQAELQTRINDLKARIKSSEVQISKEESSTKEPLQGKQKLLDALEHLAKRLEVRAED